MIDRPLRILYVAAGIPAPGTVGGSTHVVEVTAGLARREHTIVTLAGRATASLPPGWPATARLVNLPLPKGLALASLPLLWRLANQLQPDVIMERYYNFAGAGLIVAGRRHLPRLLEVNAPLWDPPGSPKERLDHYLPGHPLRRWATWQARAADRIVAPLPETVTMLTPHPGIVRLPWGANTTLFNPNDVDDLDRSALRAELGIPATATVVVFAGSFRRWHGIESLYHAARPLLIERPELHLLLIGQGERWPWAQTLAQTPPFAGRVTLTGQVTYTAIPRYLALADLAVAPFDIAAHAPLREIGFYWSPLKVFEAMAMALPVVVPTIPELTTIARDGLEAMTFEAGDLPGLSAAMLWLTDHPAERRAMGQRARERVVEHYSWAAHCRELELQLLLLREEYAGRPGSGIVP
jgi:glycosyltransferase involved in cell wall biosynthesis